MSNRKAASPKAHVDRNAEESRRILERIERESESVGTSSMARASNLVRKSISGIDGNAEDEDPIEVLGKRIGRTLGWGAMIALLAYLLFTYIL